MPPSEISDREELIGQLRATGAAFLAGCEGTTDLQGKFKPAPDRWSIEECAEHIALVENGLLMRLSQEAIPSERAVRGERQAEMRKMAGDRSTTRQAPERARPTGRFGSLRKALEQFAANREKTIAYLSAYEDDLHAHSIVHLIGTMSCHEFVVFMSTHTLRHLEQIVEIQKSPGYPA
jgi:DinB superfamily